MYYEDIDRICNIAEQKVCKIKNNFLGYLLLSILAGIFVGFGVLFAYTSGGMLEDVSGYKLVMGVAFSVALSLIYFAGGELFTGNCFSMTVGYIKKKVSFIDSIKILFICYIGNFIGSAILAGLILPTGLMSGEIGEFIAEYSSIKMNLGTVEIITRGILCNILVSLATWCGYRMKSESGKFLIIIMCVAAFFTIGFEHSIANMSLLLIGVLNPFDTGNTFAGLFYNISLATIGNIIGASLFLAVPYVIIGRKPKGL